MYNGGLMSDKKKIHGLRNEIYFQIVFKLFKMPFPIIFIKKDYGSSYVAIECYSLFLFDMRISLYYQKVLVLFLFASSLFFFPNWRNWSYFLEDENVALSIRLKVIIKNP